MDVAIVAPCPVPYVLGGAENLVRGLQDHINEHTGHQAEVIKLPSPEHSFWDLVDSYRRFSELDLGGFDLVISTKYPAWMVSHPRHVAYVLHKLRGLYDTYHFLGMPDRHPGAPAPVEELRAFMAAHAHDAAALPEFFGRLAELRGAPGLPEDLFVFPGPFIREVVHFLDGIGLAPQAIRRYGAISATVRDRPDYFPPGAEVFVGHPPTALGGLRSRRGSYLFTTSRLDEPKRVHLLVEAMRHVRADVELRIAGGGPQEARLRELAAGDRRIVFCGRLPSRALADFYAHSRAVAFVPYLEDFGLVALEAMLCGKPVITCTDAGGPTELVEHGATGLVVAPEPEAIAAAVDRLWSDRKSRRAMGRRARVRAARVTWDAVVRELAA